MSKVLVVNGPNLNLLGRRRPEIYGIRTLAELEEHCRRWGSRLEFDIETFQSNHEGELVDRLHRVIDEAVGVVLNPGALAHYSYALHDAVEAIGVPTVEVHISNIKEREQWRRQSVVAPACVHSIYGRGLRGYQWALHHLRARLAWPLETIGYGAGDDRRGDLRLPEGTGPFPIVVLFHGGFWRDEWTRDLMDGLAVDLAQRGWATWNVEYHRVGSGGGWPVTLLDAAAAVDVLGELAATRALDLSQVVFLGHSAGGQLALWAAARNRLPPGSPGAEPVLTPSAVVALAPLADLAAAHRSALGDGAVEAFLRRTPEQGSERYAIASPTALLPLGIPMVIVHGDADEHVPAQLSRDFAGGAADAGDRVVYHEFEGVRHFELLDADGEPWQRVAEEIAALR